MKKKESERDRNHQPLPSPVGTGEDMATDPEDDAFWQEIQSIWDKHSRQVDEILAHRGEPLMRPNAEFFRVMQRRWLRIALSGLLSCCSLFVAVYGMCTLWKYATPTLVAVVVLLLVVFVMVAVPSIYVTIVAYESKSSQLAMRYLVQITMVVAVTVLLFPFLSHGQLGDGLVMTQCYASALDHMSRVETIQVINNIMCG